MLGGMAGGGMGFIFDPSIKPEAQNWLQETLQTTKKEFESRLPFAMDPVVYDFAINDHGTFGTLASAATAQMPYEYYALLIPEWLKLEPRDLSALSRFEMETLGAEYRTEFNAPKFRILVESILPEKDSKFEASESLEDSLVSMSSTSLSISARSSLEKANLGFVASGNNLRLSGHRSAKAISGLEQ